MQLIPAINVAKIVKHVLDQLLAKTLVAFRNKTRVINIVMVAVIKDVLVQVTLNVNNAAS